nr:hypothetical protein Iba_chr01aCG14610 [Ipomoea batatas]
MHSLVLRFFQQRLDPPPAVLESPEGFAVEQHPSHHSRHRSHRLQHHRTTTIPPLKENISGKSERLHSPICHLVQECDRHVVFLQIYTQICLNNVTYPKTLPFPFRAILFGNLRRINAPVTNNGGISSAAGSGDAAVFLVLLFLLVITHSHRAHSPRPHNREPHPRNHHFLRSLGWIPIQQSRRSTATENSSDPCLAACSSRRTTENCRRKIARGNVARQRSGQPRSATAHHLQQTIDQTKEIGNCKSQ